MKFPSQEQREFLFKFRAENGSRWKAAIQSLWATGKDEKVPLLRQIRNTFGPLWLNKLDLDMLWQSQVNEVSKHYLAAAAWAECHEEGGVEFTEKTQRIAFMHCASFIEEAGPMFDELMKRRDYGWHDGVQNSEAQFGHDYWLTRNGHGAGFWDRGLGEVGDKLSELCKHKEAQFYIENGWLHLEK